MSSTSITRSMVRKHIKDDDRVLANVRTASYVPETEEHRQLWPRIHQAVERGGEKGVWFSALKAIGRGNPDYAAYLIGQLHVLRCPALEQRLGIDAP